MSITTSKACLLLVIYTCFNVVKCFLTLYGLYNVLTKFEHLMVGCTDLKRVVSIILVMGASICINLIFCSACNSIEESVHMYT